MINNFSRELKGYYSKTTNSIRFKNGRTLNQLANDIWEDLGYKNMDPSILSRVLKGERLFTYQQLLSFCKILKLSDTETHHLSKLLTAEKNKQKQLPVFLHTSMVDMDFAKEYITQINSVTRSGQPRIGIEMSENLTKWVFARLKNSTNHIEESHSLQLIVKSNHEQIVAKNIVYEPADYLKYVLKNSKTLFKLTKSKVDQTHISYIYFALGIANYVNKNYKSSIYYYNKSLEFMDDPNLRIHLLRDMCIGHANTGNYLEFRRTESQLISEIEKGEFTDINEVCCAYEGIAKCESLLNESRAYKLLWNAKDIYMDNIAGQNNFENIIKIQLLKSEAEIHKKLNPGSKDLIRKPLIEALEISQNNRFDRYTSNIIELITSIL